MFGGDTCHSDAPQQQHQNTCHSDAPQPSPIVAAKNARDAKAFILGYKNDHVLRNYMTETKASAEEAEVAFQAMKQFLYAAVVAKGGHAPSHQIDKMWHTFILFTQDYRAFCEASFGMFIDHVPSEEPVENSIYMNTRTSAEKLFGELNDFMWPDFSLSNYDSETTSCRPRPAPCTPPGQCNPKCNLQCNPMCNPRNSAPIGGAL